jgi:Tol biopolymer transport system component
LEVEMRRILFLAAAATATAIGGVESAGGAFPGANGRIVFARGNAIETIDPTTAAVAPLVASGAHPAWSPDGRRLAFSRACRIVVAAADGSGEQALTNGRQCDADPAWSPAGDALVFTRRIARRGSALAVALYVMRADGSSQRRLTQRALTGARLKRPRTWTVDTSPSWSTSGLIAFARRTQTSNETIHVVGTGGAGLRRLTVPSARASHLQPAWSPDGATLAFTKRFRGLAAVDQAFLIEANGTGERELSNNVAGSNSAPAWSPDGTQLCLQIGFSDLYSNVLVIVRRDGALVRVLEAARGGSVPDWQPLPS